MSFVDYECKNCFRHTWLQYSGWSNEKPETPSYCCHCGMMDTLKLFMIKHFDSLYSNEFPD